MPRAEPWLAGWNQALLEAFFRLVPQNNFGASLAEDLTLNPLLITWVYAALFYLYWRMEDERTVWRRSRLLETVVACAFSVFVTLLARLWIVWPSPARSVMFHHLYPDCLWGNGSWNAFPSHSTLVFFTVAIGLWPLKRWLSVLLAMLVFVGISLPRIYLGGHYPLDVFASMALAPLSLWIVRRAGSLPRFSEWLARLAKPRLAVEFALFLWLFELGEAFHGLSGIGKSLFIHSAVKGSYRVTWAAIRYAGWHTLAGAVPLVVADKTLLSIFLSAVIGLPTFAVHKANPASKTTNNITVEWQVEGRTVSRNGSGPLPGTEVTVELRDTATAHGSRYDVRLRNRSVQDYRHSALRIRLPRLGASAQATIEGQAVAIPAEVHQWWEVGPLVGTKFGFTYAVSDPNGIVRQVGPSSSLAMWGGRAQGIVRVDAMAYVVPEFWERQPRRVQVTGSEVILTLFEGSELLRAGEDAWDRFAVLDAALSDAQAIEEAEALPALSEAQRQALVGRFGIAPEGLRGPDFDSDAWLRKYDQWQGTSWEKRYADDNSARHWDGEEDSGRTTLFSLFHQGLYYPVAETGTYTWRNYGDIQWAGEMSCLHYDWVRAALKHYLRTGNGDALLWGMAAVRHAITVDYVWADPKNPLTVGLSRYEKGEHGDPDFPPKPSHTWGEGLFLASALTGDPWVKEAAVQRAEATWAYMGGAEPLVWDGAYGELRWITWPLLILVRAFRETGDLRYWQKAGEIVSEVMRAERLSGGHGYVKNYAYFDNGGLGLPNAVSVTMAGYSIPGLLLFADTAMARGEWNPEQQAFLIRMARWVTTPMPNGPYGPPTAKSPYGTFMMDGWCPPDAGSCGADDQTPIGEPSPHLNALFADLFAWLAQRDPEQWSGIARTIFRDGVAVAAHPGGIVGFLTDQYPTTETKILGRLQLFGDRTALWLAGQGNVASGGARKVASRARPAR